MLSASSSSATVAVEKATSDLLIGPDWTMNIDICDSVNSHHWQAKDVVKALKKRLQHKSSKVQLLALTLLETMVKNCGDYVHLQIAERNILGEMVKIVRKKADMQVRDKILVLLDSWQEAFGGPGGRYPQYYFAYEELRRSGVMFPQRSMDAAPIFTPPATHLMTRQTSYGMPSNSSRRLDETMATEFENLSMSNLDSMLDVVELLKDMLQAVNPGDKVAVKDEIIVDLVSRCRSNQKKLMQMLTTTGEEELLARGLELNDSLQNVLSKHDAIASGSSQPSQVANPSSKPAMIEARTSNKPDDMKDSSPRSNASVPAPVVASTKDQVDEDEDEDDFAQLARRHSKAQPASMNNNTTSTSYDPAASTPNTCTALALPSQPEPVRTKEQDIIDLLSLTLSTEPSIPYTPEAPSSSYVNLHPVPASPSTQQQHYASQTYPGNQGQSPYSNYVVPWAQAQSQHQQQPQAQFQSQPQFQVQSQPQFHPQSQNQAQSQFQARQNPSQFQTQPQVQSQYQAYPQPQPEPLQQAQNQGQHLAHLRSMSEPQYPQFSSAYPPPPWTATPGYFSSQNSFPQTHAKTSIPQPSNVAMQPARPSQLHSSYSFNASNGSSTMGNPQAARQSQLHSSYSFSGSKGSPTMGDPQAARPSQLHSSYSFSGSNGSTTMGDSHVNQGPRGQTPFIPSYRLFEDLNVFGNGDARHKMPNGAAPSLSGARSQSMVGFRK